jgi:hypothetical protein
MGVEALFGVRLIRQTEAGQRDSRKADSELLQRPAPRHGLGQAFGQLIEFVVHNQIPFVCSVDIPSFHSFATEREPKQLQKK